MNTVESEDREGVNGMQACTAYKSRKKRNNENDGINTSTRKTLEVELRKQNHEHVKTSYKYQMLGR
jgi:hypothetical protein